MQHNNAILISHAAGAEIISNNTIIRVEAISNYSKLYFSCGRTLVVAKVLKWFDTELAGQGFIRIHRRHLVNAQLVTMLHRKHVELQNKEMLELSKRKKTAIYRFFSNKSIAC